MVRLLQLATLQELQRLQLLRRLEPLELWEPMRLLKEQQESLETERLAGEEVKRDLEDCNPSLSPWTSVYFCLIRTTSPSPNTE